MNFDKLYQAYADTVYGFLMFKLHDIHLAEDIMQEVFLAVHQGLRKNLRIDSPRAWILSVAHHKMVDHLRKNRSNAQCLTTDTIPDKAVEETSSLFVEEILNQLPDTERTIIYGLYIEGLTCKELAEMLMIPEGTIKSKAHYARKKIRNRLGGIPK